jgi:hypothetical protein
VTAQEAYEKQIDWFSKPGAVFGATFNEHDGTTCCYRSRDNQQARCAVGCLIPDEIDVSSFNEASFGAALNFEQVSEFFYGDDYDEMNRDNAQEALYQYLCEAQQLHDNCAASGDTIEEFLLDLHDIAIARHGLTRYEPNA